MNIIAIVLAFAVGVLARDVAQDWRDLEAATKAPRQAQTEPAPIYSTKCLRAGKQFIAKQADGGKWVGGCVNADLKI